MSEMMIYVNMSSTASPAIVPKAISTSRRLEEITALSVIYPKGDTHALDVYRQSSSEPGSYSKEIYSFEGGTWQLVRKIGRK